MSYKDEARKYQLLNTTFERNLSKPTYEQIENLVFFDKDCNDIQRKNNYTFLANLEEAINSYVQESEIDYQKDNTFDGSPDCGCDYDCECSLNVFAMSTFKNIARQFNLDLENNNTLVNNALAGFTVGEQQRLLSCNIAEVVRIIMYKSLSYLSYDLGFYDISFKHHEVAIIMYGGIMVDVRVDITDYLEEEISARGKKASDARWQPHREEKKERKKKYIKIMKDKGFSTYTDAASYIKLHVDTDKTPSFPTVCRLLSEADKGDFS
ncbi:hypothetical protein [Psychrobacter sp. DAB_AL62B]|uniref:hypothetical protein n=1 Tax=Psychrobacter sp. DAB_AL62B TaxID=1028420 RepID=UPI0023811BE1|nr:hypothetical protein [Psychrobacter sp. DAB_AL62B]MDE4455604.1 hypothetical protein [Psychrobacter sp. DAB_AL62B]